MKTGTQKDGQSVENDFTLEDVTKFNELELSYLFLQKTQDNRRHGQRSTQEREHNMSPSAQRAGTTKGQAPSARQRTRSTGPGTMPGGLQR